MRVTLLALLLVAGCATAPPDYIAPDAPRYDAGVLKRCGKPCVALLLGSGGPRGFAHVGVLKVLERENIRPGLVVGASVGALIGSIHATGIDAATLEELACGIDAAKFLRITNRGFVGDGLALEEFVNQTVAGRPLEAMNLPIAILAQREHDREPEVFTAGNTGVAVRASAAIPGSFPVATIRGVRYVDGDEWTPVPIRVARSLGADIVIAVDVSAHLEKTPPDAPVEWQARDAFRAGRIAAERPEADVFIHPDLGYYASITAEYRRRSIAIAERATEAALPELRAALKRSAR